MNKESPTDYPYPKITETPNSKHQNIVTLHFSPQIVQKEDDDPKKCTVSIKEVNQSEKPESNSQEHQKLTERQGCTKQFEFNTKGSKSESTCISTES
jgi:hypothetical protein